MGKNLKIAIVGLGRAGRFHLRSIRQSAHMALTYVIDPKLTELPSGAVKEEVILLPDLTKALLDDELDAVVVSSPTPFHYSYIVQALEAGKHVFAEKPLGKTTQDIQHCYRLAKAKGCCLYLGFQRRYDANFIDLKEKIKQIGHVRLVKTSSRDNPKPALEYLKISGNIFHDMLIHDFDMLLFQLGWKIPEHIFAVGHAYDPDIAAIPDYDTVMVQLSYPDGLMVSIDTSRTAAYGYDQRIELFGENGMAIAENVRNTTVALHTSSGLHQPPINYSFPQRYERPYFLEIEDFRKGIYNKKYHNVSRKECLLAHLIADAAHMSAVNRKVVDFKAFLAEQGKDLW